MKLFIVGATGRTGRLVVEQAISSGHTVTAIVRKPGTLDTVECWSGAGRALCRSFSKQARVRLPRVLGRVNWGQNSEDQHGDREDRHNVTELGVKPSKRVVGRFGHARSDAIVRPARSAGHNRSSFGSP